MKKKNSGTAPVKKAALKNDEFFALQDRVFNLEHDLQVALNNVDALTRAANAQKAILEYVVDHLKRQLLLPHGETGPAKNAIPLSPAPENITKDLLFQCPQLPLKDKPRTINKGFMPYF